ncbi:hypothetical protein FJSC11DRAFT_1944 [Fischerella thermalis JSC-11]|jgi:hypothetical protein|uniref:Ribbon-helix-helix protein CopG domain-containing protein n=1 Tax=Fischerella thermalis JSC-11 TaxID=741277 RepID=G6FS48_9CYAN|nr:hypothetical protein FJSC11DRAFT_3226 [Fischerella thermalis JSC-11]EHC15033.1 hypothetical protein FJSC11DRAFT_1944 [Fischerella thermalis JSC-11]
MSKSEANLHVRIPINELRILEDYAEKTKRTKTDLVREWVRSLKNKDCTTGHP